VKYLIGFTLLLIACTAAASQAATVPCSKLHLGGQGTPTCPRPFMEGTVDGQWLGLVIDYTGGNNGIDKVRAFSIGLGANGDMTFDLGTIAVEDSYGWTGDMEVRFVNGKLWVINPVHDYYHQSHFDFAKALVRQYGFYGRELIVEKRVLVPMPSRPVFQAGGSFYPSNATILAALQRS
jgi:hypothetical protein